MFRGTQIGGRYVIKESIDRPEGSFARVYSAQDLRNGATVAAKILREEHLLLPEERLRSKYIAFKREADLLAGLQEDARVMRLHSMGYLWKNGAADGGSYEALESDPASYREFAGLMEEAIARGWRPYLVLERYPAQNSLHQLVTYNPRGLRLPQVEALDLALQLVGLMVKLHAQGVVYWDAKPAHAFWDGKQLVLIDWNVSFRLDDTDSLQSMGITPEQALRDDPLIAAREFVYPAFVGLDFRTGSRPKSPGTPSALRVRARAAYEHTGDVPLYGVERYLDAPVREFLSRAVQSNQFACVNELWESLTDCAVQLGWRFEDKEPDPDAAQALLHKRRALACLQDIGDRLREAHEELARAHEVFPGRSPDTEYLLDASDRLWRSTVLPDR